uniref:ATP synthase F0 subunit 8 n=1 Tax=Octopus fitchi TaxID=1690671 RepID=UPI0010C53B63|nr:ATP synthase F0 subunit 8 [Octopus fitchi]QBR54754.1 ATP synthase F0 subunit 8 [Octopus fitchi]
MPQLSPLNWILLFSMFWTLLFLNSSIMWWNNNNLYNFNSKLNKSKKINFNW